MVVGLQKSLFGLPLLLIISVLCFVGVRFVFEFYKNDQSLISAVYFIVFVFSSTVVH